MDIKALHERAMKEYNDARQSRVEFIKDLIRIERNYYETIPGYKGLTFYQYIAAAYDLTYYQYKMEKTLVKEFSQSLNKHSYDIALQAIRAGKLKRERINRILTDIDDNGINPSQKEELIRQWRLYFNDRYGPKESWKDVALRLQEENEALKNEVERLNEVITTKEQARKQALRFLKLSPEE